MANEEGGPKWRRYDVSLSYCRLDGDGNTGKAFTGNLYDALRHRRFRVFMDDDSDQNQHCLLLQAIETSRAAIVIFSKSYASSTRCLDELAKILHCSNNNNIIVVPVFYKLDTSDVTLLEKCFIDDAIARHRDTFTNDPDRLRKWTSALSEITRQAGPHFPDGHRYQYEIIQEIVDDVSHRMQLLRHTNDVFLSFGEDTRYSFASFLYDELCRAGFQPCNIKHKGGLENCDSIIEESRLSIIVFSENYAYSSSCLDELVTILDCMNKNKNYLVWPIFYKVEPSDLRHQRNSYGKAMAAHEDVFGKDYEKVQNWRSALCEVANLKGWHLKTGCEYEFIEKLVDMAMKI